MAKEIKNNYKGGNKKTELKKKKSPKCYNSVSCIFSVVLIVFILGSIMWDIFITKPQIRHEINEIKTEIKEINTKLLDKSDIPDAEEKIYSFENDVDNEEYTKELMGKID